MVRVIEIYLVTDGNGAEALLFYPKALQTELVSLKYWET